MSGLDELEVDRQSGRGGIGGTGGASSGGHGGADFSCPTGWTTSDAGHCYRLVPAMGDWSEAVAECESRDSHLATITTFDELNLVGSMAPPSAAWLGGTDQDNEGTWSWITGEQWTWTDGAVPPWNTDREPNDDGPGEDCLEVLVTSFLNDTICDLDGAIICEMTP